MAPVIKGKLEGRRHQTPGNHKLKMTGPVA